MLKVGYDRCETRLASQTTRHLLATGRSIPTLEDVARGAGVSTATVSRSLNSPERVGEKTRDRVLKVVEQLGYTPNFAARVMAAKRSFTVGAIIPTMENAIFARGIQAFQEELYRRGYILLVSSFLYDPTIEKDQIRNMVARGADGLLLIGHDRDPDIYTYLEKQNVPSLVAWTYDESAARPSVGFENRSSMEKLAQEVLKYGHKKIVAIMGSSKTNDRVRQRIEGIKDALAQHGSNSEYLEVVESTHDVESAGDAFEALMRRKSPPTAIICGNDVLAVGAVQRARKLGINIPENVSITGFDDIELARIVNPPLTTVHVPHREMGRRAACELVDMIEKQVPGNSIELETTIMLRESLRSPPPS
ncbi:LacI family transcription regulator [Ahrensia sp. R2A130]|nr:LacI family transcription regulator [Ahrensia sp. R2A130]